MNKSVIAVVPEPVVAGAPEPGRERWDRRVEPWPEMD
jgi:hypothetical protein